MNTATRKQIFCVLMSSRDVLDAFERLARLSLRGKADRELVRVLLECCGQEADYNPFYAELAKLFCSQNRQFKTTFQFAFWDHFKLLLSEDVSVSRKSGRRRVTNLAILLCELVFAFHVPLSVIKPIDIGLLNDGLIFFLTCFFSALFSRNVRFLSPGIIVHSKTSVPSAGLRGRLPELVG